nr:hypothetical protein [Tanacetum cinerariifolium]
GLVKHKKKSFKGNKVLQPMPSRNTKSSVRRILKEVVKPKGAPVKSNVGKRKILVEDKEVEADVEGNESEKANESKKDNESEEVEEIKEDKESEMSNEVVKDVKTKVVKGKKKVVLSKSKKQNEEIEADVKGMKVKLMKVSKPKKVYKKKQVSESSSAYEDEKPLKIKKRSKKKSKKPLTSEQIKKIKYLDDLLCVRSRTVPSSLFALIRDSQVDMESFLSDFSASSYEFKFEKGIIRVTPEKVHDILRVPLGGTSIFDLLEIPLDESFVKEWFKQFDPKPLKKIHAYTNIAGIYWCGFIHKCLHGKPNTVGGFYIGPLCFMILLYLDSTEFDQFLVIRQRPAIRNWTTTAMNRRQELEIQDQVISKLDLHGEWTESELDQTEGFYNVGENVSQTRTSSVPQKESYAILVESYVILVEYMIVCGKSDKKASVAKDVVNAKKDGVNAEKDDMNAVKEGEVDVNEEPEDMLNEETFMQWIEKISIGLEDLLVRPRAVQLILVVYHQTPQRVVTRSSPNKRIIKPPTYLSSPYMNKRTKVTTLIKRLEFVLAILNHEGLVRGCPSPRMHFFQPVVLHTIDEEQQWKVFSDEISAQFEHDVTSSSLFEVDLAFFPICASRRFYVVVFHLKSPSAMMILDNSNCGETYNSKYKVGCEPLKKFFAMYLKNYNHPKHIYVAKLKHCILKLKWSTTKNHSDCRVFTMIHLEHYFGKPVGQWDFGLCKESDEQVLMLRRMRFKIATKILLHEFNVYAEKMFDLAFKFESENDKQTRISIIVNAIKNMDERDPAKTKTFIENHEEDALKNK